MNRTGSKILHGLLLATSGLVGSTIIASTAAMAGGGPTGGTVAVGSATIINASPTQTVVNQSSKKALINWNSFSIPTGSSVKFNQPNSKALAVNRVTGPNASTIDGQLLANGNVWLINANGVLFGKGSQINVGSLLATTSDLSDDDFKKGNYSFQSAANPNAGVVNKGTITAGPGGSVVLSAPSVSNEGLIHADLGTVVLGGANAFTVDMTGDNLLRYEITAPVADAPRDANGNPASALVSNSGTIMAAGGHVMMTARAARSIENNVINNTGMVEANTVTSHNGEIDLDAGPDGTVNDGGTLSATGTAQGQTGGTVNVTGGTVNVADSANIDASGNAGGGTVQIGGGLHGQGTLAHAQRTIIGNATIKADATGNGNGGTVAVWSDGQTSFAGSISAKGGATGGNGGQVETSGQNLGVAASAKVDTSAPLGLTGDWLLDPATINIVANVSGNNTATTPANATLTNDPGQTDYVLSSALTSALSSTNVTLEATSEINVQSDVTWSSTHALSLLSEGNVTVNANVQNSGGGNVVLVAGWNGTQANFSGAIPSGSFGANNGSITVLNGAVGSKGGKTIVAGAGVSLTGVNGGAQIGYFGGGATGDINVQATDGGVTLIGMSHYVQIGHGGAGTNGSNSGNITVNANGSYVNLIGGSSNNAYAQIGHGGDQTNQNPSASFSLAGNISVSGEAVVLQGGTGSESYVQIGNGGEDSGNDPSAAITETYSGNISVTATSGYVQLIAGVSNTTVSGNSTTNTGGNSYAQIGHEGAYTGIVFSNVTAVLPTEIATGSITIQAIGGDVTLTGDTGGASGQSDYALIGHGGVATQGSQTGDIQVIASDVTLNAGNTQPDDLGLSFAQIGNGGGKNNDGASGGNITINASGNLTLNGSGQESSGSDYLQIGSGSVLNQNSSTGGPATGNISITVGGTTTINSTNSDPVWIGNIGGTGTGASSGSVSLITGVLDASSDDQGDLGAFIPADLVGGDVFVGITGLVGETWQGLDNYDSSHTLTLAAAGDLTLTGNIQNAGSGAINLVAGWDGVTTNITALTGSGVYGIGNQGNVTITGEGTAVGSASGAVLVEGFNVSLSAEYGAAQIGYYGAGTGNIVVNAQNDVMLYASDDDNCEGCYAQIGNGGYDLTADAGGNISVHAGVNVSLNGGAVDTSYAQIGNGGSSFDGTLGGNVTVQANGSVTLTAGDGAAQIGNGGSYFDGTISGDVMVQANGTVTLTGGEGAAQIGNGGVEANGEISGNISVIAGGDITLSAGEGGYGYAQIGNGGDSSTTANSGDIVVNTTGALSLTGNGDYAQIGNGGYETPGGDGNITVTAGQNITLVANDEYAQIGNGGESANGGSGNITVISGASITLDGEDSYAQIGNGGFSTTDDAVGNITISAVGNLTLMTGGEGGSTQIGNGGGGFQGNVSGDIAITVNGTTSIDEGSWIGNDTSDGTASGNLSLITANGYIGGNFLYDDLQNGNVLLGWTGGDIEWDGFDYNSSHTLSILGTGNVDVQGDISNSGTGAINVVAGWDGHTTSLASLTNTGVFGQNLGSVTIDAADNDVSVGSAGGTTTVLGYDVDLTGGDGSAQIGYHGTATGNIVVRAVHDVVLTSGAGNINCCGCVAGEDAGFTQIGNGGSFVSGPDSGNITVVAGNNVALTGGPSTYSYASIGNGGDTGSHGDSGNIVVTAGGSVSLTGGADYAQIGNGQWGSADSTGNITVTAAQNITLTGASGSSWGYAQIGNGGQNASGNVSGNIQVSAGGALTLKAGNGGMFAQIGNGGDKATTAGSKTSGNISINAGSLSLIGSTSNAGTDSYVQLGNTAVLSTGVAGSGVASGNININITGATTFTTTAGQGHVWIGNTAKGGSETGAVSILSGTFNSDNENNDDIQNFVVSDLAGGNLTIGVKSAGASLNIGDELDYSSANNFTLLTAGNLTISGGIQNAGSGNILLVTGWNPNVAPANVLTTSGSYGNGNTGLSIGGSSATADSMIGSALGTTTVLTKNLNISAVHDTAGLGFEGVATGNIVVNALGNIMAVGQGSDTFAIIGNLGIGNQAVSGNVTIADSGSFTLTNGILGNFDLGNATVGGNVRLTASSLSASGASVLSGNSAVIALTGAGASVGSVTNPLLTDVTAISVLTNNGSAYISAPQNGLSVGVSGTGINLGSGNLVLNAAGAIGQTAAIGASGLTVTASGALTLTNSANNFATVALTSGGDASVYDAADLSIAGAVVGGNLTLAGGGAIGQTAAIKAASLTVSAKNGAVTLNNAANAYGAVSLNVTGSFSASIVDTSDLTVGNVAVGGNLTVRTKGDLTFTKSIQLQNGSILAIAGWDGTATGATTNGYGNNGGDIFIGGANAAGGVAIGSASGTTTLAAGNITLSATNGYAQIGYHGGGSGAINLLATGNVALNGGGSTGYFAQIGDGGYNVSGSSSEAISVIAGGDIGLNAGAGQEAYAQIGNGGAESNSNSSGYNETGLVTVSGKTVTLAAGSGAGSYTQIGHGGYKSGQGLNGIATLGGNIAVNAVNAIRLIGGGVDGYAQIGQGGDFLNNGAADGSSGTISGDIAVAVATPNTHNGNDPLTLTAGTGANSFAQIGNGGQGENIPAAGANVTFTIGGNVTVADLTLTGSNTGANGYAQIGNGDASKTGFGDVSGQVTLGQGTAITNVPGKAPGSSTGLGNATGTGTVTGTLPANSGVDAGTQGSVASINQNSTNPTNFNLTTVVVTPEVTLFNFSDKGTTSQGPSPLEQLADNSNSEGEIASDSVSQSVGESLGEGKTIYVTSKTLIPGMLKQIVTLTRNNPNGIPPADEDYSSWGNEALWRW